MNVMNIKHLFSAAAALSLLAACSDYDPGLSEEVVDLTDEELATINEYTANFVARYGEIDPNHTWGFGELGEEQSTRASDPKSNLWIKIDKGPIQEKDEKGNLLYYYEYGGVRYTTTVNGTVKIDENNSQSTQPLYKYGGDDRLRDFTIQDGMTIPGFPVNNYYLSSNYNQNDVNEGAGKSSVPNYQGYYHCAFGNENVEHWFKSKEELLAYAQEKRLYEIIPLGDVAVCNTQSDAEVADVYAEFSKPWTGTNPEKHLASYFVQQVWKGTATYTDPENNGVFIGGDKMDYLSALGTAYSATDTEHFYNFNYSGFSNGKIGMMRVFNSNTDNFGYHSTYVEGTVWDHYRLLYLHGNWYVGFDFSSPDGTKYADNIYNDWIVKIIPGNGSYINPPVAEYETVITSNDVTETRTNTVTGRVMCEDLGTTNDFDFDDVVFDVAYSREESRTAKETITTVRRKSNKTKVSETVSRSDFTSWTPTGDGKWTGQITLRASGGTLPIYVKNFDGTTYECHETLLGADASNLKVGNLYNPINVGHNVNNVDPKVLPAISGLSSTNPDDIDVLVYSSKGERATTTTTYVLPKSVGGQYEKEVDGGNKAPQKICVPVGTRWMREGQQIETVYTYFRNWVQSQNSEYNFGGSMDWTTQGLTNTGKLY